MQDDDEADIFGELRKSQDITSQARSNAMPWDPIARGVGSPKSEEVTLAPTPGPVYSKHHSSMRIYRSVDCNSLSIETLVTIFHPGRQIVLFASYL